MALQKLQLKPGVNRENTRYASEGGWYDSDKVRFRQGSPEKIGGWQRISNSTFLGVCRSLWNWITLGSANLVGVGTNLKFYIENGGAYYDITPLRATETLTDPFNTTSGSTLVVVDDAAGGFSDGDFVTFSGASAVGGLTLDGEYQLTVVDTDSYSITASSAATSTATGGGSVSAAYQIPVGPAAAVPLAGWGAGSWGSGVWGTSENSAESLRTWSQTNFGEDLVFGPQDGPIYYWDATAGLGTRGVELSTLAGASGVPLSQRLVLISDINRFLFAFGSNDVGTATVDPMLVRWSDQENAVDWTPTSTNQAGSIRLSRGTEIVAAAQARQEVLVWSDAALYSMQYVGPPAVWTVQLVGENISIASKNAVAYAGGVAYWMSRDKFYKYDGQVQPMRCDVRRYIYSDFNDLQIEQVFAGTNEAFNEIWWFYCSADSDVANKYVVYNYFQDIWYYGTLTRSAWLDAGLRNYPLAATYTHNLVNHEQGVDNNETATPAAIPAYISSAEFDLEDGHNFMFVWRVLPDITFTGSTVDSPAATMTLLPLKSSGAGFTDPASVAGTNAAGITRSAVLPVEAYTSQLYTRLRGRQLAIKVESSELGVCWQLGATRIDMRPDGRR